MKRRNNYFVLIQINQIELQFFDLDLPHTPPTLHIVNLNQSNNCF